MLTKMQKWANSQGLRLPKHLLQEAQINIGDELNVFISDGKIIIEPIKNIKNRRNIKELVSRMPQNYFAEELDWGIPVGKEEW